jgi:hypothetical protein
MMVAECISYCFCVRKVRIVSEAKSSQDDVQHGREGEDRRLYIASSSIPRRDNNAPTCKPHSYRMVQSHNRAERDRKLDPGAIFRTPQPTDDS